MTYSIKSILALCFALFVISGCVSHISDEEYAELCPYETKRGRFFRLQLELDVIPHKLKYQVNDTVTWRIRSTDSIFDFNRDMSFKIENYPFQPYFYLYKVKGDSWTSGYEDMDVLIDSVYSPRYVTGGNAFARSIRGVSTYIEGEYLFEFSTIFQKPGRFVNYVTDKCYTFDFRDLEAGEHPEYNNVINNSGCPEPYHIVDYILRGDAHYEEFQNEMSFIDKEVYYDEMFRLDDVDGDIWGRQRVSIPVDWRGMFGFEVVE